VCVCVCLTITTRMQCVQCNAPLSSAPNVTANSYRAALDKERVGRQSLMGKGVWGGVDEGEIKALLLESDSEISHVTGSAVFLFE